MDNASLRDLMEQEKSAVLAALQADRSPKAAQAAVEKAVGKVTLRYSEACPDARLSLCAQDSLQALCASLPLLGSVSEAREWRRDVSSATKRRVRPLAVGLLAAGAVLLLASLLAGVLATGRWVRLQTVLPAAAGGAALFFAGLSWNRPDRKERRPDQAAVRTEFLIDPETVWHCLQGVMTVADHSLAVTAEQQALEREQQAAPADTALSPAEVELFASLLASAYARLAADPEDGEARETVSAIRYYLHGKSVEAVDWSEGRSSWFDLLPSRRTGTLCPALVCEGRVLKKGLASA